MFKIYSKSNCPFCTKAKELLTQLEQPFEEVNIESDIETYRQWMTDELNWKTVPVIYYNDDFIGGYTELTDWLIDSDFV